MQNISILKMSTPSPHISLISGFKCLYSVRLGSFRIAIERGRATVSRDVKGMRTGITMVRTCHA